MKIYLDFVFVKSGVVRTCSIFVNIEMLLDLLHKNDTKFNPRLAQWKDMDPKCAKLDKRVRTQTCPDLSSGFEERLTHPEEIVFLFLLYG